MSTTAIAPTSQTVTNLLAAYEVREQCEREVFGVAIRAEVEGYFRAAALFRAAARAEQVHAAHHARIITELRRSSDGDLPRIRSEDHVSESCDREGWRRI